MSVKGKEIRISDDITLTLSVVVSERHSRETGDRVYLLPNELVTLREALTENVEVTERGYLKI